MNSPLGVASDAKKALLPAALSLLALLASQCLWIRQAPGMNSDEGYYANLAQRIAFEPGYWPVRGQMSSYTTSLAHYFPAAMFKIFGTSLAVFRMAGAIEVLLGVAMISAALALFRERKAAALFAGVVAFFPAAVINQRWIVELTTFCAFTTGLIALGMALRYRHGPSWLAALLIIAGIDLGVTAHIAYIAPVLALWICLFSAGKIRTPTDRGTVIAASALLVPFFVSIAQVEEDKIKALSLLALLAAIAGTQALPSTQGLGLLARKIAKILLCLTAAIGSLLLIPFALFCEGNWLAMSSNGFLAYPLLIGVFFLVPCAAFWLTRSSIRKTPIEALCFLPVALLLVYAMATKAGPRYFEVHFLFLAAALSLAFARLSSKQLMPVVALWVLQGTLVLGLNYFKPSIENKQIQTTFRFWRWRDASDGFLPKIALAERLAQEGCSLRDVTEIADTNAGEALHFFSNGDWPAPANQPCRLGHSIRIVKQVDLPSPDKTGKQVLEVGPYWIIGDRAF